MMLFFVRIGSIKSNFFQEGKNSRKMKKRGRKFTNILLDWKTASNSLKYIVYVFYDVFVLNIFSKKILEKKIVKLSRDFSVQ